MEETSKMTQEHGVLNYHIVFGITIASELPLPELLSIDKKEDTDVYIKMAKVEKPEDNLPGVSYLPGRVFSSNFFYLFLKDIASFSVIMNDDGKIAVTIELLDQEHEATMYAWLYGSILTAILQLTNQFALHASAVDVNGSLYLFCGVSGIGKSTLAAQLNTRGYNLFSDDKCVLQWNEEEQAYYAMPTLKIIRLWEDATENLENDDFLSRPAPVINKVNKFQYTLDEDRIIHKPMPIKRIHIIRNIKAGELKMVELVGIKKLNLLRVQTHRLGYVKYLNREKEHWKFLQNLVKRVPVYVIRRPKETPIKTFVDFVEQQF